MPGAACLERTRFNEGALRFPSRSADLPHVKIQRQGFRAMVRGLSAVRPFFAVRAVEAICLESRRRTIRGPLAPQALPPSGEPRLALSFLAVPSLIRRLAKM